MKCMPIRRWFLQAAMPVREHFPISRRAAAVCLLVLMSGGLLWLFKDPEAELRKLMEEKRKIPVQFQERDLENYYLYHTELVQQSPVFRFMNLNNTFSHGSKIPQFSADKPVVFVVTPTYTRRLQKAELTNMCNTMRQTSNVFWIIIEDSLQKTELIKHFLLHCGIPAVHMNFKSYFEPQLTVDQRNAAIQWIKRNTDDASNRVLYFADDDNTYDPGIFEEMRFTRKVSVWPVGLASEVPVEGPIVKGGKVVDWASGFSVKERKFPIDMAGFAVNVGFLNSRPAAKFRHDVPPGFLETSFMEALEVEDADLEPRADNCNKVLVWHTQSMPPRLNVETHTKRGLEIPPWEA